MKLPRVTPFVKLVVSDILVTISALAIVFYGWYTWLGDVLVGLHQAQTTRTLVNEWATPVDSSREFDRARGKPDGSDSNPNPPVVKPPATGRPYAMLHIPRFGENFVRTIGQSVEVNKVLNNPNLGVGHYVTSSELGETGNFAIAGHRTTFGASFGKIDELRVGDRIYLETKDGWYVYRFRNIEFVYPTQSSVLRPVPSSYVTAKDRLLTMTSCHPKLSAAERIIAYSVFESFVPRRFGEPIEISTGALRDR